MQKSQNIRTSCGVIYWVKVILTEFAVAIWPLFHANKKQQIGYLIIIILKCWFTEDPTIWFYCFITCPVEAVPPANNCYTSTDFEEVLRRLSAVTWIRRGWAQSNRPMLCLTCKGPNVSQLYLSHLTGRYLCSWHQDIIRIKQKILKTLHLLNAAIHHFTLVNIRFFWRWVTGLDCFFWYNLQVNGHPNFPQSLTLPGWRGDFVGLFSLG